MHRAWVCFALLRSTPLHLCCSTAIRVFPVLLAAVVGVFISSSDPVGVFHSNYHIFDHTQILAGCGDGSTGGKGPSVQGGAGVGGQADAFHLALRGSGSRLSWESCRNAEMQLLSLSGAQQDSELGKCSWLTKLIFHAT